MRCLLIEHPDGLVLVDTGAGNKEDDKFLDIYGVENAGNPGPTQLEDALRAAGHQPEDVRWVINTHLHFDHAGGNHQATGRTGRTRRTERREACPPDPPRLSSSPSRTRPISSRSTSSSSPATPTSGPAPVICRITSSRWTEAGRWKLVEGDVELLPGILTRLTPGHVPWHQSIVLSSGGETAIYLGDLIPTSAHLPLAYIMGYDLEPLRTLESKRALFREALAGEWLFIFEHDSQVAMGRAVPDGQGSRPGEVVTEPEGRRTNGEVAQPLTHHRVPG